MGDFDDEMITKSNQSEGSYYQVITVCNKGVYRRFIFVEYVDMEIVQNALYGLPNAKMAVSSYLLLCARLINFHLRLISESCCYCVHAGNKKTWLTDQSKPRF